MAACNMLQSVRMKSNIVQQSQSLGPSAFIQCILLQGKGDGKGANRSGTNGALERQGDRRSSVAPKAAGAPPQAGYGYGFDEF